LKSLTKSTDILATDYYNSMQNLCNVTPSSVIFSYKI